MAGYSDDYSYEEAINKTSLPDAPWFVVPADDKTTARFIVAKTIYDVLSRFEDIKEPDLDAEVKENLELYIRQLKQE